MAQKIARRLAGEGVVVQIDTEKSPRVSGRYDIRGIPAFVAFKSGRVLGKIAGTRPEDEIVSWFLNLTR